MSNPSDIRTKASRWIVPAVTPGTLLTVANRIDAVPIFLGDIQAGRIVDAFGIRVSTAGAGAVTAKLGLYTDLDGAPGAMITRGETGLLTSAGGVPILTGGPIELPPIVWGVSLFSAGTTQPTVAAVAAGGAAQSFSGGFGISSISGLPTAASGTTAGLTLTGSYSAGLPDSFAGAAWAFSMTAVAYVALRAALAASPVSPAPGATTTPTPTPGSPALPTAWPNRPSSLPGSLPTIIG